MTRPAIKTTEELAVSALYRQYTRKAAKRNLCFSLSRERFTKLIRGACAYCGRSGTGIVTHKYRGWSDPARIYRYCGIDRRDNTQGYTVDNTETCCGTCNSAKNNLTLAEWDAWREAMVTQFLSEKHRKLLKE